jgi:hypothetical protein
MPEGSNTLTELSRELLPKIVHSLHAVPAQLRGWGTSARPSRRGGPLRAAGFRVPRPRGPDDGGGGGGQPPTVTGCLTDGGPHPCTGFRASLCGVGVVVGDVEEGGLVGVRAVVDHACGGLVRRSIRRSMSDRHAGLRSMATQENPSRPLAAMLVPDPSNRSRTVLPSGVTSRMSCREVERGFTVGWLGEQRSITGASRTAFANGPRLLASLPLPGWARRRTS